MITLQGLTHVYPGHRKTPPHAAVRDLSLHVPAGEFCVLTGPNGSGKSTLFRILCGTLTPSAGRVEIAGADLFRQPDAARRALGVVFQSPAVDKQLSVRENLRLHATLYGLGRGTLAARLGEALEWSDLEGRLDQRVDTLSGGLARQVELAKCLLTRPRLLLLDEPTTGLDPASRMRFLKALHTLQRQRDMTVLMTSHIFAEAEAADRVAVMMGGHLLALDSPGALRDRVGREMLVVEAEAPDHLHAALAESLGRVVTRHGDELRLEGLGRGDGLALLEQVLAEHRDAVRSVAIRRPDLEDVFVHITGRDPGDAAGPAAEAAEVPS